ncbi:MAG: type II secretion system secretin GspD [Deltaproteobacteria bacterium]|nr:type II secretion system secretin GspD [Deltaproteobacteria bacterium]
MLARLLAVSAWFVLGTCLAGGPARALETAPPGTPPGRPAPASVEDPDGAGMVTLNFDAVELVEVIHVLARHLRLNYTIGPDVQGVVTIFSGQPVRREDLLPIFHEILRVHGAVAVRQGSLYRITAVSEAPGLARPGRARGAGFAMRVLPVRFFPVAVMKRLLTPFMSTSGTILDHVRGNYLVVVDSPSNIRRLSEIKDLIDVEAFSGARMELYRPRAAAAGDLAREMSAAMALSGASAAEGEPFAARFLPLPRIDQLLVIAYSDAAWNYVKHWIERIDVAGEDRGRQLFIRAVENRKATELARVLNQVYGRRRSTSDRAVAQGSYGFRAGAASRRGQAGEVAGHISPSSGANPARTPEAVRATEGARPTGPSAPPDHSGEGVRVVAESDTNSLVILATPREYADMARVLEGLDLVPRQVLMEVLVAEVTLTDDFEFGVEYALAKGGFGPPPAEGDSAGEPAAGTGLQALATGFTSIVDAGRDFRVFVKALMQDARVKVLSSPHLLAVDNRPARIRVGSEQPVATGTVVSRESEATTTTIEFKEVGRILTIVPRVNSEGLVNLQVRVEVSDVGERVVVGRQSFDAFNVREAETAAVLHDGQTLVIGGIITDNRRRSRIGIPLLMDVPVLGPLFRTDFKRSDRTELVILITPRVIHDRRQGDRATKRFLDKVRSVRRELEEGIKSAPLPLGEGGRRPGEGAR